MADLGVRGGTDLSGLAARLRGADKALMKELRANVTKAVKPLGDTVTGNARSYMPSGYGPVLARSLQHRITQRAVGSGFAVTMTTSAKGQREGRRVTALDKGDLRHPTFGNRTRWVRQRVKAGFWTDAVKDHKDDVRRRAAKAVQDVARKVAG